MSLEARKLYSIRDLAREAGISQRFVSVLLEHHGEAIPYLMDGERLRFPPEAVPVLARLWREYKKGVKEDKAGSEWFADLLEQLGETSKKVSEAAGALRTLRSTLWDHPPHRIFYINSFPGGDLKPTRAIAVHVDDQGRQSRATLLDADLEALGETDKAAVLNLREVILRTFLRLEVEQQKSEDEAEQFSALSSLIRRAKAK